MYSYGIQKLANILTLIKGGSPGPGLRQNVPAIGLLTVGSDDLAGAGGDGEGKEAGAEGAGDAAGAEGGGGGATDCT